MSYSYPRIKFVSAFCLLMLNRVIAQFALPSFQAVHKPHKTVGETKWDAGHLSSGVYLVQLKSGDRTVTQKLTLFK